MPGPALRILAVVVLTTVVAACGSEPRNLVQEPAAAPTIGDEAGVIAEPTTAAAPSQQPAPTAPPPQPAAATPGWVLGATPLPKGPDGTPLVLPTPPALRDRRLTAPDRLPPPGDAVYRSSATPIDAALATRMGTTWQPGCPVPLADLRHVTLSFWGFDGRPHTGELVVNAKVAADVQKVFGTLFTARFPLEDVRVVEPADLAAEPTGDGNTTAAFVCRPVRGSTSTPSAHSSGLAIDINPFQNPYKKGKSVLPELAGAYLDRSLVWPGMIRKGDVVTRAFAEAGWTWGGSWTSTKDTMHFSANGR